ncbi:MAG TPA: VWA domain-containing protein [Vicinamibacteria bacterium]|nr:VWA domain-containing protein [Vicinamibacteria bacterium]
MGPLALALCLAASTEEPPRFPATAEIVRIDAVVLDVADHPVAGLTAADFTVEENGKPREIASFEPIVVRPAESAPEGLQPASVSTPLRLEPQDGRALLIYFDDIHVSPASAEWVRHNLGPFLEREVRPGDVVTIVTPHGGLWWTARTPWEHAQLPAVVARLIGQYTANPFKDEGGGDWSAMQSVEYGQKIGEGRHTDTDTFSLSRGEGRYGMALLRIRRSLNGLERAIASLDGFRGRKSVIIYSEGFVLSPQLPDYERIVDQCRRAGVTLFVQDPLGLQTLRATAESSRGTGAPTSAANAEAASAGSTHIALATGGRAFALNDATEAVARVLEESKAYYLIGFRPAEGRPGERSLRVRVRRDGLRVQARNRYYWGDPLPRETRDARTFSRSGRCRTAPTSGSS